MVIDDSLTVDAPLVDVWAAFKDVPRVATCIPGATIDEVVDPSTYRGTIKVSVGPVSVAYQTTLTIEGFDDTAHRATLEANGTEKRGRGGVRSRVSATADAIDAKHTRVTLHADANISGIIATVGGRLIEGVAKKTIAEFGKNLSNLIRANAAQAGDA